MIISPMGPGWLFFFRNEYPEGGFEYTPILSAYEAAKIKDKRKQEIIEIVEDIAKCSDAPEKKSLEIGLRLRLSQRDIEYRKKYLDILHKEVKRKCETIKRMREEDEITAILMLIG